MKSVNSADIVVLDRRDGARLKAVDTVNDRVFARKVYHVGVPKVPVVVYNGQALLVAGMKAVSRRQ